MSRQRILSVYPKFPPSFWGFQFALRFLGKPATMPPTGLATVAAMIPEKYFEVQGIIDTNVRPLTNRDIENTDLIFTSSMIVQRDSLDELIKRAHAYGKKVVAGGPYPTSYRDRVDADYLVLNEAETTLGPFLEDLLQGSAEKVYDEKSVASRNRTLPLTREGKPLITHTPLPRWDLLDLNNYASLAIQYSRGCPFHCNFCDITALFGYESRTKTPAQMIAELESVYATGWRGQLFIVDDNFIGNKRNVRVLLPEIARWQKEQRYPFSFFTEASMDLGMPNHADILKGMVDAGFDQVFLGIESVDPEVLKKMDKGQNLGNPYHKVRAIQEAGLEVTGGFIIGGDGEKPSVFDDLFKFIQTTGIVMPMPGLLTALKDTKLYAQLKEEGRLVSESTGNNTHQLGFNFKPELDETFLIKGYVNLLERLFDPKNYYERCRVLASRRGTYHATSRTTRAGVQALSHILYEKLIRRPEWAFVRYVSGTLLRNPREFPEAIAHAVKLYHFETMTDATSKLYSYPKHTETLYERFQQHVHTLKGNIGARLHEIERLEQTILDEAKRRYDRLHKDFRQGAQEAFESLRERIAYTRNEYSGLLIGSAPFH